MPPPADRTAAITSSCPALLETDRPLLYCTEEELRRAASLLEEVKWSYTKEMPAFDGCGTRKLEGGGTQTSPAVSGAG